MLAASVLGTIGAPLLQRPPEGDWRLVQELREEVATGTVLHGSRHEIDMLHARPQTDYFGRPVHGIFATRDPIWPMFYALLDRTTAGSLRCPNVTVLGSTRYLFSTENEPAFGAGYVHVVDAAGFEQLRGTNELVHPGPTVPVIRRIPVSPADFPFLHEVTRHETGDSMLVTARRARRQRRRAADRR